MPDVVVIGGGAVGLTTAALLARSGFQVELIEQRELPPEEPGPDPEIRVLALTPASEAILQACGAWENLDLDRVQPWTRMQVWGEPDHDGVEFLASDINKPQLGHIVENTVLVRALHKALQDAGVTLHCPDSVARFEPYSSGVTLDLESGAQLDARLVVAADGADSKTRSLAGFEWDYRPYREQAIVAEIETELPGEPTAWQRFTLDGPAALLPLFNRHYSLVWSTTQAEALMDLDSSEFEAELTEAVGGRLGAMQLCGQRVKFPLGRGCASHWCADGIVLVGDAAHVVHPLAGLGQNLGLMDAAVLQEEIAIHSLGLRALRAYERRRKGPVRATQYLLEGFRLGFGSGWQGFRQAGDLAMELTGRYRAVRRFFIHQADGCLDGPRWLRAGEAFPGSRA